DASQVRQARPPPTGHRARLRVSDLRRCERASVRAAARPARRRARVDIGATAPRPPPEEASPGKPSASSLTSAPTEKKNRRARRLPGPLEIFLVVFFLSVGYRETTLGGGLEVCLRSVRVLQHHAEP